MGLYIAYNMITRIIYDAIQGPGQRGQGVTFNRPLPLPRTAPDQPILELLA